MRAFTIVATAFLLAAFGCASRPAPPVPVMLQLDVDGAANQGRPLRVVVETVDERSFANASYQSVVERALSDDPPVLASQMVFPGSRERIKFLSPAGGLVAIYALFTEPGDGEWKHLVQPPLPKRIHLRLAGNEIAPPAPRRCWLVFW